MSESKPSTPKAPKAVKAWAVIDKEGNFDFCDVFGTHDEADSLCAYPVGERVIPVWVTPVEEEK